MQIQTKLTRPLCSIDLETTGTKTSEDRIVQISVIKIFPDGTREKRTRYVNPEMPIPEGATAAHGITDDMVKDEPPFSRIAYQLHLFVKGCDILAYNGNGFDVPLLYNEFARAGVVWDLTDIYIVDAMNIFKRKEERTLEAAVKFYCFEEHIGAHDAEKDAQATISVLEGEIDVYEELQEMDIQALSKFSNYDSERADVHGKFCFNENGEYVINFGSNKGKLASAEIGFVEWMMRPDKNFSPDTIKHCQKIIELHKSKNNA